LIFTKSNQLNFNLKIVLNLVKFLNLEWWNTNYFTLPRKKTWHSAG